jgi:hypothetical protein
MGLHYPEEESSMLILSNEMKYQSMDPAKLVLHVDLER